MRISHLFPAIVALSLCAGCAGQQSALDPAGPHAQTLLWLIEVIAGVCALVWLLVMIALFAALRRRPPWRAAFELDPRSQRRMTVVVGACVGATAVIISIFTVLSLLATRDISPAPHDALSIRLRGYQFWWEATYLDDAGQPSFVTANELHIPVGRPVRIELKAADVIHSFWIPSLAGKQDMIPGRDNAITLTADRAGVYRGQCAEFCGLQHAHMGLLAVAEDDAAFAAWQAAQKAPALDIPDGEVAKGRQIFLSKPCAACHAVRGTPAVATLGPDLTHIASRRTIAAGLAPTTRGSLAAWIADPQTMKPGANMPMVPLTADELQAVSAYMASLR
jgi:cytochrome c oxidase subunit 2